MLVPVLAAGAAVLAAGYHSMAPKGQWFGRAFYGLTRGSRQIALTFDDGPNDPHTFELLNVLARHDVLATFFMIGGYVQQRPEIAREVAQRGHVIGNHTFTHPFLALQSLTSVREELRTCRDAIANAVGEHSNLFRPPWGARRPGVFRVARELGFDPVMWSATGYDWNAPSAEYIQGKVIARIRGGDVVLLHDGGHLRFGTDRSNTVKAVDALLTRYKAQDYEFVTIPEMQRLKQSYGRDARRSTNQE
jgi:peptidoglycan/xylan/chitin deacetylase (PgdA/CDA1 family)